MNDTNTSANGTGTAQDTALTALFATKADCEAAKPTGASNSLKPFEVLHSGTSKGWVLARGHANAIEQVARLDGYSATTGVRTAPVTKEAVAAKVMEMSDDEFKALVAAQGGGEEVVTVNERKGCNMVNLQAFLCGVALAAYGAMFVELGRAVCAATCGPS